MKKLFIALGVSMFLTPVLAQEGMQQVGKTGRFEFRVAAGTALTILPDFDHTIIGTEGLIVPGVLEPGNARSVAVSTGQSKPRILMGWYAEAEAGYRLPRNYSLSVSVGLKKLRYDYSTKYPGGSLIITPEPIGPGPITPGAPTYITLDDFDSDFGKTSLLYLTVNPNISKGFLQNRLIVRAGPTLNFLLKDKTYNTLALYTSQESIQNQTPDQAYFSTLGEFNKTMVGLNLGGAFKIAGPLSVELSAQYYLSKLYKRENDTVYGIEAKPDKIHPILLQAGVSFAF